MNQTTVLRLGHSLDQLRPTLHNGPGWRIGLWTQGCSLLCTRQCLNPHFLSSSGGLEFSIDAVISAIEGLMASSHRRIEGLTVLGGEPTDQLKGLIPLLAATRAKGLTAMVYTGHYLGAVRELPLGPELLQVTDLLVDGPFIPELYDDHLAWRGSTNQNIHCLSNRYSPEALTDAFRAQRKGFSLMVRPNGRLSFSGLQHRQTAGAIERILGHGKR